jgi:hypothetical protein
VLLALRPCVWVALLLWILYVCKHHEPGRLQLAIATICNIIVQIMSTWRLQQATDHEILSQCFAVKQMH